MREVLGVVGVGFTYLLTYWSNKNADELFLDVVCDGGHDAPIGEGNRERLHVELIVSATIPQRYVAGKEVHVATRTHVVAVFVFVAPLLNYHSTTNLTFNGVNTRQSALTSSF